MYLRSLFEADSIPILERMLSFSEARHRVLAENVANAETPSWRRKDLRVDEFRAQLERAVQEREKRPGRFSMREVDLSGGMERGPFLFRRSHAGMLRHDENNVDMDREMALLGRNGLFHNTVAALLKQKYGSLRTALSGRGAGRSSISTRRVSSSSVAEIRAFSAGGEPARDSAGPGPDQVRKT